MVQGCAEVQVAAQALRGEEDLLLFPGADDRGPTRHLSPTLGIEGRVET